MTENPCFSYITRSILKYVLVCQSSYSLKMTVVISPSTFPKPTKSPSRPVSGSLSITTTCPSSCAPTATSVPALFRENWRGPLPPDGASCSVVRQPVSPSMAKLTSVSETMVPALVVSRLGISKMPSARDEMMRKLESASALLAFCECFR